MGQAKQPTCPDCGAYLILAPPPGGKGRAHSNALNVMKCGRSADISKP
jgi:hypothetical protein